MSVLRAVSLHAVLIHILINIVDTECHNLRSVLGTKGFESGKALLTVVKRRESDIVNNSAA
jgi:hypothetical protein